MISRKLVAVAVTLIMLAAALGTMIVINKPQTDDTSKTFIDQAGSETMYELCIKWAEVFEIDHDDLQINVTRGGSGPGIAALLDDKVDIAQASRKIKSAEMTDASSRGMNIIELKVALDGIAMLVNPFLFDNNITELSLDQLKGLYNGSITNWKYLGGPDVPVLVYGRNNTSGTFSFFQENVLNKENYTSSMIQYDNYDVMIADILAPSHHGAIGYVGVGFVNNYPDVKILSLKMTDSTTAYKPTQTNVESFDYPLSRYLYVYLNEKPNGLLLDYVKWIIDQQKGQSVVVQQGFYPIPQSASVEERTLLEQ